MGERLRYKYSVPVPRLLPDVAHAQLLYKEQQMEKQKMFFLL